MRRFRLKSDTPTGDRYDRATDTDLLIDQTQAEIAAADQAIRAAAATTREKIMRAVMADEMIPDSEKPAEIKRRIHTWTMGGSDG